MPTSKGGAQSPRPIATPDQIAQARQSGYSDAEIVEHLSSHAPDQFKAAADAGYSPTEILNHFAGTTATSPAEPVSAAGLTKATAEGLRSGVEGTIGLPGDLQSLQGNDYNPFSWLTKKAMQLLGPQWIAASLKNADRAGVAEGMVGDTKLPTSAEMSDATGKLLPHYVPKNEPEQIVHNVSSFIPSAIGGPESVAANVLKRGVLPGVVSEVAGQATKGTAAEPYARVAGALISKGAKKSASSLPAAEQLMFEGGAGSQAVRDLKYATNGAVSDKFTTNTLADLDRRNLNAKTSPETTAILQDYQGRPWMTAKDYDELKLRLNASQEPAAGSAVRALYDHVDTLQPTHALYGDPAEFQQLFTEARGNYAAGARAKTVADAAESAQLNVDAHSRQNIGNATRQSFKRLLTSDNTARGFNAGEMAQVEKIVRGTTLGNLMRHASNALGGGGEVSKGVVMGLGGLAGSQTDVAGGAVEGAALPLVAGALLRRGANASVLRQVQKLDTMVRSRAPMAQTASIQNNPAVLSYFARMLARAVTAAHAGKQQ